MEEMNGIKNLFDIYRCCICFEPMESAVSFDPCGHEIDEGCANAILSSKKGCPICRVDVNSFRPAYTTRQAVEVLLQNMQHPEVIGLRAPNVPAAADSSLEETIEVTTVLDYLKPTAYPDIIIHVNTFGGGKYTYIIDRDSKAVELYKRVFADTKIHPSELKLLYNSNLVSIFSDISKYIPLSGIEFDFYQIQRLGHMQNLENDYPLIFQKAVAEVVSDSRFLHDRFFLLYKQAINQAMNS